MRTREIRYLRPREIVEELENVPVAYLPIGLLEWHNPANPFGTDAIQAEKTALLTAERAGGVVFPTLYCGTGRIQSKERLKLFGFIDTDQRINGVDFPYNTVESFYYRLEIATAVIRENLRLISEHGYKVIVIVIGHAEAGLLEVISKLCEEFTSTTQSKVVSVMGIGNVEGVMIAHAGQLETSTMMYCVPECVDLEELPAQPELLYKRDWGIIDLEFDKVADDGRVLSDPRDASAEIGKTSIEKAVDDIAHLVAELLNEQK